MTAKNLSPVLTRITPELAEKWLATMPEKQRRLDKKWVDQIIYLMQTGEWSEYSNDSILIDTNGQLINGQHRLTAVAKSGLTTRMYVEYNVDPKVYEILDQGKKRAIIDYLPKNLTYSNEIKSAAEMMYAAKHGAPSLTAASRKSMSGAVRPSRQNVVDEVNAKFDDYQFCARNAQKIYKKIKFGSKAVYTFTFMMLKDLGKGEVIEEFSDQVTSGESKVCRGLVDYLRGKKDNGIRIHEEDQIQAVLYAYEKFKNNDSAFRFSTRNTEPIFLKYERAFIRKEPVE